MVKIFCTLKIHYRVTTVFQRKCLNFPNIHIIFYNVNQSHFITCFFICQLYLSDIYYNTSDISSGSLYYPSVLLHSDIRVFQIHLLLPGSGRLQCSSSDLPHAHSLSECSASAMLPDLYASTDKSMISFTASP